MKDYRVLLFDLDGTLTESEEGILNCMRHAFITGNMEVPEYDTLRKCIGPPLMVSFRDIYGLSQEEAEAAVIRYRERYAKIGLFENRVYDGIPELLKNLKACGYRLGVATSKPEIFAVQILHHFGLDVYFDAVAGSSVEKEGETKADMIRLAMARLGLTEEEKTVTLMIGDRRHDIEGAQECGLDSVGVYYGYAPLGEHEQYGATYIAKDVEALGTLLLADKQSSLSNA